ncbi:proteasome regulatory subunit C-terminal-domain-containing protein [Daldinia sp. FL1419]|nr:proteasome regulatory subunit C-terminal-domain-containing protein [Daldinia sp. FL1419]
MPGKTPHSNGNEPVENGIRKNQDVDMTDEKSSLKGKGKKGVKEGEDMTVVVPPSKTTKQSQPPPPDADGDVDMDVDKPEDLEVKVDPVTQAIAGMIIAIVKIPLRTERANMSAFIIDVKSNFALLDRAVALFDARFSLRALRSISSLRKRLTPDILAQVIAETFSASSTSANVAKQLLIAIGKDIPLGGQGSSDMEIDSEPKAPAKNGNKKENKDVIPEIDIFLSILVQVYLFDSKQFQRGAEFSKYLSERIHSLNRRTLDSLSAKVYFYYSLFCEQLAPLPPSPQSPIVAIRPILLTALRTAVLRKDIDIQASVIVLLLRSYLLTSHISQADLLVSHTQFPENAVNNQVARFLYYLGRIRAIQLRYTEAHEHLTAATRKAPASSCALGFAQTATKLLLVVELLMGDIPERATFRVPNMEQALHPYFLLVQAVRVGNLEDFEVTIADHADTFRRDGTYSLILRLRQNVIKTGIRMMSLSYSRISLRDICIRLHLGSEESAEYIVAKAIRDGVIEATLDRERGFMKSKEVGDVYATREPGEAFHDRIRACLALHDESVKAMRFPMNQHRLELKNAQEAREREREMAKEIQEGDLDEDDLGGDFEGM